MDEMSLLDSVIYVFKSVVVGGTIGSIAKCITLMIASVCIYYFNKKKTEIILERTREQTEKSTTDAQEKLKLLNKEMNDKTLADLEEFKNKK